MNSKWREHLILRRLCKGDEVSIKALSKVREEHFTIEAYREAYKRLNSFYNKRNQILKWNELINDSFLPEKLRAQLRALEVKRSALKKHDKSLALPKDYNNFLFLLNEVIRDSQYYHLVNLQNTLTEKLKQESKDINGLISYCSKSLENINSLSNSSDTIISLSSIKRKEFLSKLKTSSKRTFIPTGFANYDKVNLGIPRGSFFILAADTGGGKSTVARQIAHNIYQLGGRACIVSMEMSLEEHVIRLLSSITDIPTIELYKNPKKYKKTCLKAWKKFWKKEESNAATLDFYIPDESISVQRALNLLKPYMYDLIVLDYLTLFAQTTTKQHESLDEAGRFAKIWATKNDCVVLGVSQWDRKEDQLRYSRALMEHASNAWQWVANEKQKELGYITITQPKARGQKQFTFRLSVNWDTGKVETYTGECVEEQVQNDKGNKKNSNKPRNNNIVPPLANGLDSVEY